MPDEFIDFLKDDTLSNKLKIAALPKILERTKPEPNRPVTWLQMALAAPVVAAIASIATVLISESFALSGNRDNQNHAVELEKLKFEHELIRIALSEDKAKNERADALLFFQQAGLLKGLDETELKDWKKDSERIIPFIPELNKPKGSNLTISHYKQILGENAYGPTTADMIPSTTQISMALGDIECQLPLEMLQLPFSIKIDWDTRQYVNKIRVHKMAINYFRAAFDALGDQSMREYLQFTGTYHRRKMRGGSQWSPHAWGIAIDFNSAENGLRKNEDTATMPPDVVKAFKNAGFAWLGDTGVDFAHFILSTDSLDEIRNSGTPPPMLANNCTKYGE